MSTVVEEKTESKAGKKYRIIVRSADEAVRVIQRKLGPEARVISVRQVGGQGLAKFISSPKLEVIAEIPPEGGELGNEVLDSSENLLSNACGIFLLCTQLDQSCLKVNIHHS